MEYYGKTVFNSKDIIPSDLATENSFLIIRRELIAAGTAAVDLRLRDVNLYRKIGTDWKIIATNTPTNEDN